LNKEILHSAIRLLSRREHSVNELTQKLLVKQFEADEVAQIVEYLVQNNYLSNIRFTESVIRNKVARGYGWQFIKQELKQKGIASDVYLPVLEEQTIDWYLQASLAYNKRFGTNEIKDQKDKAKRLRFLQYRGYSVDECLAALNTDYID